MLKYIKNHLATIGGIEIFPIISFVIFFAFFIVLTIWVINANKVYINKMANLPLENDQDITNKHTQEG